MPLKRIKILNNQPNLKSVLIIGAGLAGSDAAWFLAQRGIRVVLVESKRKKRGPAQKNINFAELVCTNSLKSLDPFSAHGILKHEMKAMGSLILEKAYLAKVPAGDALSVDRDLFSKLITEELERHELISIYDREAGNPIELAEEFGCQEIIISSGPLTTKPLENWMRDTLGCDDFYFYDAIAPVVDADSLNYEKLYYKDRHRPISEDPADQADYLNAPLNQQEYESFIKELCLAEKVKPKDFEEEVFFEACLPVDLMAQRGVDTARFSCMKPIGLEMPSGEIPYACVQLRRENLLGSAFNLVGFQTRLTYGEQKRVFRMIPGLEEASFIHFGSVHRNSFLNAKKLLNPCLSSKKFPNVSFAGQITGVEGYTESASCGLYVAFQVWRKLMGQEPLSFPVETGVGALINYLMTTHKPRPSSLNFGLLPSVELSKDQRRDRKKRKKIKKELVAKRAVEKFESALGLLF